MTLKEHYGVSRRFVEILNAVEMHSTVVREAS